MVNLCHTAYFQVNKKMPYGFAKTKNLCKSHFMPRDIAEDNESAHPKARKIIERIREELRTKANIIGQTKLANDCHMDQPELHKILRAPEEDLKKDKQRRWRSYRKVSLDAVLWAWQGLGHSIETLLSEDEPVDLSIKRLREAQVKDASGILEKTIQVIISGKNLELLSDILDSYLKKTSPGEDETKGNCA